jgi:hypothetical protein
VSDRGDMDDGDAPSPKERRLMERIAGKPQSDRNLIAAMLEHAAEVLTKPLPAVH